MDAEDHGATRSALNAVKKRPIAAFVANVIAMGLFTLGLFGVITVLYGVTALGANAAEGDAERVFPSVGVPAWYFEAPGVTYADAPPSPYSEANRADDNIVVTYSTPQGGRPATGVGDLSFRYAAASQAKTDTLDIPLDGFPELSTYMGTNFTDAFVIPDNDTYLLDSDVLQPLPRVELYNNKLVITRPDIPCVDEPWQYDFQIALLGDNGFKYLADVDVNFGTRAPPIASCGKGIAGNALSVETYDEPIEEVAANPDSRPENATEAETEKLDEEPVAASEIRDAEQLNVIWLGVPIMLLIATVALVMRRKNKGSRFNDDGSAAAPAIEKDGGE